MTDRLNTAIELLATSLDTGDRSQASNALIELLMHQREMIKSPAEMIARTALEQYKVEVAKLTERSEAQARIIDTYKQQVAAAFALQDAVEKFLACEPFSVGVHAGSYDISCRYEPTLAMLGSLRDLKDFDTPKGNT